MIAITALREKIRKKIFIAVTVISVLLTLLLSTGSASITIGGEPLTGYEIMMPIVFTVLHTVSCVMATMSAFLQRETAPLTEETFQFLKQQASLQKSAGHLLLLTV